MGLDDEYGGNEFMESRLAKKKKMKKTGKSFASSSIGRSSKSPKTGSKFSPIKERTKAKGKVKKSQARASVNSSTGK